MIVGWIQEIIFPTETLYVYTEPFLKLIRNSRNIGTNKYLTKSGRVRRLPIEAMSAN